MNNNILRIVLCGVILPSIGCGTNAIVHVDHKFNSLEIEVIKQSARDWYDATQSDYTDIVLDEGNYFNDDVFESDDFSKTNEQVSIQKISMSDPGYEWLIDSMDISESKTLYGAANSRTIVINWEPFWKDDEFDSHFFHKVLLHEFGHFYGLAHRNGTLMHPFVSRSQDDCIDLESAEDFCAIHDDCQDQHSTC